MTQALTGFGFSDVVFSGVTGPEHRFTADRSSPCPCCSGEHTRNHWCIREVGPRYTVRSYSKDCRAIQIDALGRQVEAPPSHGQAPFVDLVLDLAREEGWNVADVPLEALRHGEIVEFTVRASSGTRYAP